MRFESGVPGDLHRRLLIGALLTVTAAGLAAPAFSQTIRFSPSQPNFPSDPDPNKSKGTVDVFLDNVPAVGLKGFSITFSFDSSNLAFDPNLNRNMLDPNLDSVWGSGSNVQPTPHDPKISGGAINWSAHSTLLTSGFGGPSGTVKLGTITFRGSGNGVSGNFI